MAKIDEAVAIGIGVQSDQATVNTAVSTATDLITAAATGSTATGILLRNNADLAQTLARQESDGGVAPGSLSRVSGALLRVAPAFSFTIDAMGSRGVAGTPDAGDFNLPEYMKRIFAGARLVQQTPTTSTTEYEFAATSAGAYHTLKIWRGAGANSESWVLVGCTFNLTFNFEAGQKATITVDVVADSVDYDGTSVTFPPASVTTAYGTQEKAAPILESAANALATVTRGFQSATLAISYPENVVPDCNAAGGELKSQGTPRLVSFEASYFADTGDDDYDLLTDDLEGSSTGPAVSFRLGAVAGAGDTVNSLTVLIPNFRVESNSKEEGDSVMRRISGYAAISGDSGFGSLINEELRLACV
jgi:hypothetical protein